MPAKSASKKSASLHADAKEFVPSFLKTDAKPSAEPVAKSDAKTAPKAEPTAADVVKAPPAPVPAKPAWGAPSEAVKKAAPIKPQPQQQQAQKQQDPGKRNQKHSGHQRENHRGGDNQNGRKRGDNKPAAGKRNEHSHGQPNDGGGSWARAAKQGANAQAGGGNHTGGGNSHHRRRNNEQGDRESDPSWTRGKVLPIELLTPSEADGKDTIHRIVVADLLDLRLACLAPPEFWEGEGKPTTECLWESPTRISEIEEFAKSQRKGGDVVFPPKGAKRDGGKGGKGKDPKEYETAPPIEECKALEINEETRWKAKVMEKNGTKESGEAVEEDSKEEVLRKALLILNKLSLTKFDKLSDQFIQCGIGRDVETLTGAVGLIVNKAQEEQHFSSMYAGLCLKLANTHFEGIDDGNKKGKRFKKILLERCQTEFETETSVKIEAATKDITEAEEVEYHSNLIKKHYLGHMRFIGELYKGDLISIKIMLFCLPQLLMGDESPAKENIENGTESSGTLDEEKVECFAKLMTVIGSSLEMQSEAMKNVGKKEPADSLAECWKTVEILAGRQKTTGPQISVSNRIKFMLQDLLEMKQNGKSCPCYFIASIIICIANPAKL